MLDINENDVLEDQKKIEAARTILREAREKAAKEEQLKTLNKQLNEPQDVTDYLKKHIGYYIFYFVGSFLFVYIGGDFLGIGSHVYIRHWGTAFKLIPSLIVGAVVTGVAIYKDVKHFKWVQKDKEDRGLK